MATTDLNRGHVTAGAEALQREDWENSRPLIHYVPTAETVLAAVAELPKRQISTKEGLRDLENGSVLSCAHGCKIAVLDNEHGFPEYHVSGEERPWPRSRVIEEHAPLTVLFEAEQ